jgi:hypothetical protein
MSKIAESEMMPAKTLAFIQSQIHAPKGQFNSFGKYRYRSAEDIIEAVKPIINPLGYWLIIQDQIVVYGDRHYVQATVELSNGTNKYTSVAYAREEESKKGMDGSQVTGASSSYARKYALSALFCLDNGQADSDATNQHQNEDSELIELWEKHINSCTTQDQLVDLYKANSGEISRHVSIQKLFTKRKIQLNK